MSSEKSASLFEYCAEFANQFSGNDEPKGPTIKSLLDEVDDAELCAALGMAPSNKYHKIKYKTWKHDVSRVLTLAYLCTCAWAEKIATEDVR